MKNFICFNVDGQNTFKILAGYHQYFAVKKAIESTKHATVTDGKGGVFWHTQGSGKSLSMAFYAHYLQEALESPTMADNADPYVIEKSKKELGQMEAILGADQTIDSLVNDILDHYENYRENILTGKAMIVAYSRPIPRSLCGYSGRSWQRGITGRMTDSVLK